MRFKRALLGGLCGTSLTRGLRSGLDDLRASSIAAHDAAHSIPSKVNRSIPVRTLDTLLAGRHADIRLRVQAYQDGQLPTHELLALLGLLVASDPKVVLEIGTFCGETTRAMAMNLPDALIHTVDLPLDFAGEESPLEKDDFHLIAKRKVGQAFLGTEYESRIRQHLGDSANWNFKAAAGATFFFIDGSHTYDYCKSDSEKCFDLCGGRGVFLWHDCDDLHPGVLKFIAEWRDLGRNIVRIDKTPICYWSSF